MAEKIAEIFDFGAGMITFEAYSTFLEKCLNESPPITLIKLAFRIYDINNDKQVDELDLDATMDHFEKLAKGV